MLKQGEKIGLQDREGNEIKVGDKVEVLAGIGYRIDRGSRLICLWNIPNHRFGFTWSGNDIEEAENSSSLPTYATPKNAKKLKVISSD